MFVNERGVLLHLIEVVFQEELVNIDTIQETIED